MDHEEMKVELLRLAVEAGFKGPDAIDEAGKMYDFVRGRGEHAKDDMASLPLGGKAFVGTDGEPQVLKNEHVTVVGKDGDLKPPFSDYMRDPNA